MTVSQGCYITACNSGCYIFFSFWCVSWIYSLEVIFQTLLFIAEFSKNAPRISTSVWNGETVKIFGSKFFPLWDRTRQGLRGQGEHTSQHILCHYSFHQTLVSPHFYLLILLQNSILLETLRHTWLLKFSTFCLYWSLISAERWCKQSFLANTL